MLRSSITSAGVLLLGASAFAQSSMHSTLRPVTSTVRDAGVYHYGLGTWTRHTDTANGIVLGKEVIYSNTCPTGYYTGLLTSEYFADEGRIPGPNGPVVCDASRLLTNKGCACSYTISAFQIAYCSGLPGTLPVDLKIGFQGAYTACAVPTNAAGVFLLTGLPGANNAADLQNCWLVTVDLAADSTSFSFAADGASCTWTTPDLATNHLFGWTFQNDTTVTGVGTNYVGPLISGSGGPQAPIITCSMVDNTRWDTLPCAPQGGNSAFKFPNNTTEDGWGMDTQDRFRDDTKNVTGGPISAPSGPGCYFFGGNPGGSFHLKLFANTGCPPPQPGVDICRPIEDNLVPQCPCNGGAFGQNQPTRANAGCNALNIPGQGGQPTGGALLTSQLLGTLTKPIPYNQPGGEAGANRLQFTVAFLPRNASTLLIQGTLVLGTPLIFGQGVRCCGGPLKRLTPSLIPTDMPGTPILGTAFWPPAAGFFPGIETISKRSNNLPGALVKIMPGQTYCYFAQYRNTNIWPNCLATANFNKSQTQLITWQAGP